MSGLFEDGGRGADTIEPGGMVHDYVREVRAQLSDLGADDVEELTGGLEADLAEQAADLPADADLRRVLGAPEAYAAELRSSAGLPPRTVPGARPSLVRRGEERLRARRLGLLTRYPWLRDLLPVWWLARGFALAAVFAFVVLGGAGAGVLAVALVGAVVSFWWSRRPERAVGSGGNRLLLLANAVALVALLPVAGALLAPRVEYVDVGQSAPVSLPPEGGGVWVNGEPATNLYVYDAAGNRIDRVRIFNQYGQSVGVPPEVPLAEQHGDGSVTDAPDQEHIVRTVFPVRWGLRTGWEPSMGKWEPPIRISELPPPTVVEGPSASVSPSASGSSSGSSPSESASARPKKR